MPNTPITVPNQRVIKIHREKVESDFLGIKNENWQYAARDLNAHGLLLYLYLAANADNFSLALSPAACRQATGMPPSTYRDQFTKLVDKGYLVQRGEGNIYDFYEIPQRDTHTEASADTNACRSNIGAANAPAAHAAKNCAAQDREINIDSDTNNINICGEEKQVSPSPLRKNFRF